MIATAIVIFFSAVFLQSMIAGWDYSLETLLEFCICVMTLGAVVYVTQEVLDGRDSGRVQASQPTEAYENELLP